jgi:hypothetical protein
LLAIQKPEITGVGPNIVDGEYDNNYVTVEFKSGPNVGGNYSLACYAANDAIPTTTCDGLAGLEPQGVVESQRLPRLYGTVANNVTVYSETVDCFVFASGLGSKVEKCQVR